MDILDALKDLHRQATVERSHHYVGRTVEWAIKEIEELRSANAAFKQVLVSALDRDPGPP